MPNSVSANERCLRCGQGWTRATSEQRHPCPACGEPQWGSEADLPTIGRFTEYEVVAERSDNHKIITLELAGILNRDNIAVAVLSHRLKEDYRHQKGDLSVKDGRELVITFDKPSHGPDQGRWVIRDLRRRPVELRPSPNLQRTGRDLRLVGPFQALTLLSEGSPAWKRMNDFILRICPCGNPHETGAEEVFLFNPGPEPLWDVAVLFDGRRIDDDTLVRIQPGEVAPIGTNQPLEMKANPRRIQGNTQVKALFEIHYRIQRERLSLRGTIQGKIEPTPGDAGDFRRRYSFRWEEYIPEGGSATRII